MTVILEIAQSAIPRLCQFLGDYTRMSRTFKSDFLSRCSFFVYILSPIQIAPIVNCFPFEFITLVAVRGPFMSCCYPMFVDVKPNLLFHILRNALLLFLCLFLFHWCFQFPCNTHLDTGHFTGWCLQHFAKQGIIVHRMNVCSWLSDKTSLPLDCYKTNYLSAFFCLSFCLNVFTNICHSIA